jgi:hypothetical protein
VFSLRGIIAISIVGLAATSVHPDQQRNVRSVAHRVDTDVSLDFRTKARDAAKTIPATVWKGLTRHGWRVHFAEFVIDAAPSLRGAQPRGWPRDMTWENTDAVHLPEERLLVFAEKRRRRDGKVITTNRIAGVLRHEVGHAFDKLVGKAGQPFSSSPEFFTVYQYDSGRVPANVRDKLQYYLQMRSAGRQETFAEAFAIVLGGGSDPPNRDQFLRAFPNVTRRVKSMIETYGP